MNQFDMMKIDKKTFRQNALQKRDALSLAERAEKSRNITDRIIACDDFQRASTIMGYMSFRSEVDADPILRLALSMGKQVVIPITVKGSRTLLLSEVLDMDLDFELDFYGIRIPRKDCLREVTPTEVDLVLVPGVAFSEDRYRMGYGAGYYDNFIETLSPHAITTALAFEAQIFDRIPVEPHDKQMNYVITEDRLF